MKRCVWPILFSLILTLVLVGCGDDPAPVTDAGMADSGIAGSEATDSGIVERNGDAGLDTDAELMDGGLPTAEEEDVFSLDEADPSQVAAALRRRRIKLELREREVIQREQVLRALEASAAEMSGELRKLKGELQTSLAKLETKYEEKRVELEKDRAERAKKMEIAVQELAQQRRGKIAHLVSTIKGMRAASGAGLLASMDEKDAVEVLQKLSARQAASFLGAMPPDRAAKLAQDMLGPRLPPKDMFDDPQKTAAVESESNQ